MFTQDQQGLVSPQRLSSPAWVQLLSLLCALGLSAYSRAEAAPAPTKAQYRVATSTYPVYSWARALLKGVPEARVELLTPPEQDPSLWVPSPEVLTRYQEASLIALNGARFEKWLPQVSLPPSRTLETAEGLRATWLTYEHAVQHQHGPGGAHSHEGVDGHTWLDPLTALKQAEELAARLKADLPARAQLISANLSALEARFKRLDVLWLSFAQAVKDAHRPIIIWASHPAYQYLARRYKLPIKSFDISPDQPLNSEEIGALLKAREGLDPETHLILWWEGAPSEEARRALAPLRLSASVTVSPLETKALSEAVRQGRDMPQYFQTLSQLFKALKGSLPTP